MVPAVAPHVTLVFVEPTTLAVNCTVLPICVAAALGLIETATVEVVVVDDELGAAVVPEPQPTANKPTAPTTIRIVILLLIDLLIRSSIPFALYETKRARKA